MGAVCRAQIWNVLKDWGYLDLDFLFKAHLILRQVFEGKDNFSINYLGKYFLMWCLGVIEIFKISSTPVCK